VSIDSFQSRELELKRQLAEALAQHDGKSLDHSGTRYTYEGRADEAVTAWRRNPREPATAIDRLCQAVVDNDRALAEHRQELAAQRAAMNPQPSLNTKLPLESASFDIHDRATGRIVRITLTQGGFSWAEAT